MNKKMRNLLLASTLGLVVACGTHKVAKKDFPEKAFDISAMDTQVHPGDDFYHFVNGGWTKTAKIPASKSVWGTFPELREKTDNNSLRIAFDLLKQNPPYGSEAQKIKDLFASYINWDKRNREGLKPLEGQLYKINQIHSLADLKQYLEEVTLTGDNPICPWSIRADMKDSSKNSIYLSNFSLGLGISYYQKDGSTDTPQLKKYKEYISTLLSLVGEDNTQEKAQKVVDFETRIANLLFTSEEKRDPSIVYNPYTIEELSLLVKNIDIPSYLKNVGVSTDRVIVSEIRLYKEYDKLICLENIPLLKTYLKTRLISSNAHRLNQELDNIAFEFYDKYLRGQKAQRNLNMRALSVVNSMLGEAFGKLYVEKYFPASAKEEMLVLIGYLRKSFAQHIKDVQWMSDTTKEKALEKLNKLNVKVGYPDKWTDYSSLTLQSNDVYYENLKNIRRWYYQRNLNKIGKPVDKSTWSMTPQNVNAYYSRQNNEIVFPAAILQPPFFNPEADPAVNFGGIGAVIGHEITHGFDDSGAEFDADGNLKNWWEPQDKDNFKKLTKALADQFSKYEPVKGVFVNGITTSGENIADLGGLNIAYDALQLYLKDHGKVAPISGFTQEQRFFIAWATVWRSMATDKYTTNQVKTDPHTPQAIRAYAPLLNIESWYKAFEVKKNNRLYKKPEERIVIW